LAQGLPFPYQQEKPTLEVGVMKSLNLFRLLGLLVLLTGLAGVQLYAQEQQPASQDPAAQSQPATQDPAPQSQSDTSMSQQPAQSQQIFVGKIAKSKGDLVFKDDAGTVYKLDNLDQAKDFVGKTVTVTGRLDTATNTIHVINMGTPHSSQ
jgi:predicted lipid-binding transport protein (Tim44 family)